MRTAYNVRERSKQIHIKRAIGLPPTGRHETEAGADEFRSLRVIEEPDAFVIAFARDAVTVRNGDRLVLLHMEAIIAPLVPDDVSRPLSIRRPVARVAAKHRAIEVSLSKAVAELLG
jgi:hypothetical protein